MNYQLYPLKDLTRLPEICSLFARGLAETTPEYWKWKHFSENGHPGSMILVAETDNGCITGMFALQPMYYRWENKTLVIVQMMDLVIDPAHRGTGLMKMLFQYAQNHYSQDGCWGFLGFPNDISYPILMKYGAADMGDICSYETAKRPLPFYREKKHAACRQWQIALTDVPPEDLFDTEVPEECRMTRSAAFLQWKFAENPETRFQWLTLRRNGILQGYMTVSIMRGRFRRAVNIYDWVFHSCVDAHILRQAVKLLLTHGNWVNLWGRYSEADLELWAKAGVSHRSAQNTHFLLIPFDGMDTPRQWHLSRADLDY